jgi:serine/threonine protein kinase
MEEREPAAGRFRVKGKLGFGSFGEIFDCVDLETGSEVALKIEPMQGVLAQLKDEATIYRILAGGVGVPRVFWSGAAGRYNCLAMDKLGPSLEDLISAHRQPFSLKTTLMLVDQMLARVQFLHEKFILHRDIKPDNFLMGLGPATNIVYIIDFGLSHLYRNPRTAERVAMTQHRSLTGTARYASVNAMRALEHGRRDDMESLGYVWVYLLRGNLPWQGLNAETQEEKMRKILKIKESVSFDELCSGLPSEFTTYFEMVRAMAFEDEPPYVAMRAMFRDLFLRLQFVFDCVYDWTEVQPEQPKLVTTQPVLRGASSSPRVKQSRLVKSFLPKAAPAQASAAQQAAASPEKRGMVALLASIRVQIPRPMFRITGQKLRITEP